MGTIASGLASHTSVSRLLYVMGRDNVIPQKIFGYIHPRLRTQYITLFLWELLRSLLCLLI